MRYLLAEARMHRLAADRFPLGPDQRAWQTTYRAAIRRGFAANLLHAVVRRQRIDWRAVAAFARAEPSLVPALLEVVAARVVTRLRSDKPPKG